MHDTLTSGHFPLTANYVILYSVACHKEGPAVNINRQNSFISWGPRRSWQCRPVAVPPRRQADAGTLSDRADSLHAGQQTRPRLSRGGGKFCNRGGVHGFVWPQIASGWAGLLQKERMDGAEAILAAGKGGKTPW